MELVGRKTFEQAVDARLTAWERMKSELERCLSTSKPASREQIHYRIDKLEAKYGAAISKLKELGLPRSGEHFRISESPPPV